MRTASPVARRVFSTASARDMSTRATAAAGNSGGIGSSSSLSVLSAGQPRHSGGEQGKGGEGVRRSLSPGPAPPEPVQGETADVAPSPPPPPSHHRDPQSICSSCSHGVADTPPLRHSTQPRALSTSPCSSGFIAEDVPMQVSGKGTADMPALMPATATLTSPAPSEAQGGFTATTGSSESAATASLVGAGNSGNKNSKRNHNKAATAAQSHQHHHHRRRSSSSGRSGSAETRSASERCKVARTLAAELMSALMERPPAAAQIAQYRVSLASSATAASAPAKEAATATAVPTTEKPQQHRRDSQQSESAHGGGADTRSPPTSSAAHSFLEAVRNGRVKATAAATLCSSAASTPKGSDGSAFSLLAAGGTTDTPPPSCTSRSTNNDRQTTSPTLPPSTSSTPAEGPRRKQLELMPEDTSTIPQLLSVLREIALSCASLDTLGKAAPAAVPPGSSSPSNGSAPASGSASVAPTAAASTKPENAALKSHTAPAGGGARTTMEDLDAVYEEQWQRVRSHLEVVRGLVLNGHELASTLDETLGSEWRAVTTSEAATPPPVDGRDAMASTPPPPSPLPPSQAEKNAVRVAKAIAATPPPTETVVPVMPTPVDHEAPLRLPPPAASAVKGGGGSFNAREGHGAASTAATFTSSTSATTVTSTSANTNAGVLPSSTATTVPSITAATTTTTMLNHNARPFHSRTPPTFHPQLGLLPPHSSAAAATLSVSAPSPVAHGRGGTGGHASHLNNSNGSVPATSMKQLSESSTTYSPSQHVATYLERSTPPSSARVLLQDDSSGGGGGGGGDGGGGGLLNFPSTPLSEAAAPYQPSLSLMSGGGGGGGTSPRGNASNSGSTPFHLESREEMLRRRSAAPNAFYASMSHSGATHYLGGPPSAATTPGTFVPSAGPPGSPPFMSGGNGVGGGARSMPVSPLLSYGSPIAASQCPYDYILVLDFEATCEEHPPPNYLYEIIEFPVVVVDVRLQRVVAEFHRFVRPRFKVELSYFCKELTGMRQADVDAAAPLEEVILQFERWLAHTVPPHARCVFATDGPMDMREFMYHHSVSRQGIRFPPLFYQYIDVKQTFACFFQCSQGKIKAMLEVLHVPFEGRLHSGLDDARNIASIVIGLLQYGCSFCEVPLNRLPLNGLLLSSAGGAGGSNASGSTPLSLPPSTAAAAGSGRPRSTGVSPTYIAAPYSVDEDEYSY